MPKRNRLQLDFSISSAEKRQVFLKSYLDEISFTPTSSELELMANYVLWGDSDTNDDFELKSFWNSSKPVESLDALRENPAFLESRLSSADTPAPQKKRQVFSREEAREKASPDVLENLEKLWREIDILDLETRFYENHVGKTSKPPRASLVERFTLSQLEEIRERAASLTEYAYLKKRHLLVEKRTEQYQWKDTYTAPMVLRHCPGDSHFQSEPPLFAADIPVLPLGLASPKLFPSSGSYPDPASFSEADLRALTSKIWDKPTSKTYFDFRDPSHLYAFTHLYSEIWDDPAQSRPTSTLSQFFQTFSYYRKLAQLPPVYDTLLSLKMARLPNEEIATRLNTKFGKTYGANYISTLYRKKILPRIAEAAALHFEVAQNLFFPENFKKCKDCGLTLLRIPENFMRKAKSSDGFSPRCKACDKALRDKRSTK